jgi:hypothetical protein
MRAHPVFQQYADAGFHPSRWLPISCLQHAFSRYISPRRIHFSSHSPAATSLMWGRVLLHTGIGLLLDIALLDSFLLDKLKS